MVRHLRRSARPRVDPTASTLDHAALRRYGATLATARAGVARLLHPAAIARAALGRRARAPPSPDDSAHRPTPRRGTSCAGVRSRSRSACRHGGRRCGPRWSTATCTLDNALLDSGGRISGIVDFGDMSTPRSSPIRVGPQTRSVDRVPGRAVPRGRRPARRLRRSVTAARADERALVGDALHRSHRAHRHDLAWGPGFPRERAIHPELGPTPGACSQQFAELGLDETARRLGAPRATLGDRRPSLAAIGCSVRRWRR